MEDNAGIAGVGVPALGNECPSGGSHLQSRPRQGSHRVCSSSQNPSSGRGSGASFSLGCVGIEHTACAWTCARAQPHLGIPQVQPERVTV